MKIRFGNGDTLDLKFTALREKLRKREEEKLAEEKRIRDEHQRQFQDAMKPKDFIFNVPVQRLNLTNNLEQLEKYKGVTIKKFVDPFTGDSIFFSQVSQSGRPSEHKRIRVNRYELQNVTDLNKFMSSVLDQLI